MSAKRFSTRICNKTDSVINLTPASNPLVPLKGEIVIGTNGNLNEKTNPFIIKVGDGTSSWASLPQLGPSTFAGSAAVSTNPAGEGNQVLTVAIPADKRTYSRYSFNDSTDDTSFTVAVTGGSYMLAEHFLLLDNSACSYDRLFDGITIQGVDNANICIQKEWVSAYDIMEIKIAFYQIGNTLYATVTSKAGFTNGGVQ